MKRRERGGGEGEGEEDASGYIGGSEECEWSKKTGYGVRSDKE